MHNIIINVFFFVKLPVFVLMKQLNFVNREEKDHTI